MQKESFITKTMKTVLYYWPIIIMAAMIFTLMSKARPKHLDEEGAAKSVYYSTRESLYMVENAIVQSVKPIGGHLYQIRWLSTYEEQRFSQQGTAVTSYEDIKIGDKVSIHVDPTSFNHVTKWTPSGITSW